MSCGRKEINIVIYKKNYWWRKVENKDEAVRLHEKGLSTQNLANFYQMSRQAMWRILKKCGCKFMTYSEVGRLGGFATYKKYGSFMKNKEIALKSARKMREKLHNQGLNPTLSEVAHREFKKAIKRGIIKRQPCEVCSSTIKVGGHHSDYSKPLEVKWLCNKHHGTLHFY